MLTRSATTRHTVLGTRLGDLTIVRHGDSLTGLYFPHHWYKPDPATFGRWADDGFGDVADQLAEYLVAVWKLIAEIPYGHTTTYGEIARRLGGDLTAQEVGAAVGGNPLCILVPCHRVVGSTGKLTGYAGGLGRKRALLDLEQGAR